LLKGPGTWISFWQFSSTLLGESSSWMTGFHLIRLKRNANANMRHRDRCYSFEKPVLIPLVQLAIAVLYDLGLDKAPSKDPALSIAYEMKGILKPPGLSRTMEERRALLGCFLMSSVQVYMSNGCFLNLIFAGHAPLYGKAALCDGLHTRTSVSAY
jgi:hypothetical protein